MTPGPRIKFTVLVSLALSVMALAASSASAEVGARVWVINNSGELANLPVNFEWTSDTALMGISAKIAGISVEVSCTSLEFIKMNYSGENGTFEKGAKIKLSGCTTKLNGATSAPCEPKNAGTEKGVVLTKGIHGLVRLHTLSPGVTDDIIEYLPDEGETIEVIETSAECAIGTKIPVIGKFTYKDCAGEFLVHLEKHLISAGPLTEVWMVSKTAEHAATFPGSFWMKLAGTHAGRKWSIKPT
jgi:hypothetical protein